MSDMKLYKILETFDNLESATDKLTPVEETFEKEVDESQTKVQTMGNKVRVTTDGDTTEFDDTETAKAMMGADEDENKFATEAEEVDEEVIDEQVEEVVEADEEVIDEQVEEVVEADAEEVEEGCMNEMGTAGYEDEGEGPEFKTFDAENANHRKRLQRGTPVVLSPEVCPDPEGNRRGVFLNRSQSGFFGEVHRDCDGKTIKVHLSDIVSADIVNNSVYEEFGLNLEAMLAEDITVTNTSNLENPENDTTTVTAVGQEAVDELAAIMANAGMDHQADPYQAVDTGEPAMDEPAAISVPNGELEPLPMLPADEPEVAEGEHDFDEFGAGAMDDEAENFDFTNFDDFAKSTTDWDAIDAPDADLAAIEADPELREDDIQYLSPEIAQAIIDGADIAELIHDESVPQKDREALSRDLDELMLSGDNELTAYENLATRIYDQFGGIDEERDIEHANTPNEQEAGVDMVTHGTSGGLNRPKRMHKPAAGGDNPMGVWEEYEIAENWEDVDETFKPFDHLDLDDPADEEDNAVKCQNCGAINDRDDMRGDTSCNTCGKDVYDGADGSGRGHHMDEAVNEEWEKPWEKKDDEAEDKAEDDKDDKDDKEDDKEDDKDEVDESKFVNEHESVDSFLNLYKEFSIRGEKK